MFNPLTMLRTWLPSVLKRLDPHSEQVLLNAGIVLPDGKRPPPSARLPEGALRNSAVYSCIKLLSETIASLPVRIIETATKVEATSHPLAHRLREPNPEQTAPEFWEMVLANYFCWGSGYCEVFRQGTRIVELVPFAAGHTEAKRINGRLVFVYTAPGTGQVITLQQDQVMAFQMFGLNHGHKTFAPIWVAQRAIELALTQEQTATENFSDGLRPDIIIKLPPEKALEKLSDLGPEFLKQESLKIQNQIAGARTRRELYLPFGYDSTPYSANFQQAQFRETRDFQILEFCRVWRVPPSKLGVISKQPNANTEQDNLSFYQDTLRPVLNKLEKRLERDLLTERERGQYSIRFYPRAILRGDIRTATEQYTKLWQIGTLSRNEIRDYEDLPPIEGGDEYMIPTNMTTEQIGGADQSGTNPQASLRTQPTRRILIVKRRPSVPCPPSPRHRNGH
jgi:HK97 family phage portal protein